MMALDCRVPWIANQMRDAVHMEHTQKKPLGERKANMQETVKCGRRQHATAAARAPQDAAYD